MTAIPRATYRVQLNRAFDFRAARAIVPYLAHLGISHLYTSPFLKARAGSLHGYDIVDHEALNPEIGTQEDFEALVQELKRHQMGLMIDVVPNHMGVFEADNRWWLDVLENGPASRYAGYFDIDSEPPSKLYSTDVALHAFLKQQLSGAVAYDVETLYVAKRLGRNAIEVA